VKAGDAVKEGATYATNRAAFAQFKEYAETDRGRNEDGVGLVGLPWG
jgi:hypothetical protein